MYFFKILKIRVSKKICEIRVMLFTYWKLLFKQAKGLRNASDTTRLGDATAYASVPCPVFFFFFSARPIRVKLGQFAPTWAVWAKPLKHTDTDADPAYLGRNSKNKKKKGRFEVCGWCERVLVCEIEKKRKRKQVK